VKASDVTTIWRYRNSIIIIIIIIIITREIIFVNFLNLRSSRVSVVKLTDLCPMNLCSTPASTKNSYPHDSLVVAGRAAGQYCSHAPGEAYFGSHVQALEQRESVMLNSDIFSKFSELYVSADDVNVDFQPSLV